jgi:CMP-2-keto-3-deoxyoctulosonic acid synthetase
MTAILNIYGYIKNYKKINVSSSATSMESTEPLEFLSCMHHTITIRLCDCM